jgi:WD40 repeat protein
VLILIISYHVLSIIAGATQVKFNRKNQYLLASAHDKDVNIWDIRVSFAVIRRYGQIHVKNYLAHIYKYQKGSVPVTTINAHSTKIYGIDWSRQNDHDIVTCGLDKTVKVRL